MKRIVKRCDTVGNAYMVVEVSKYGRQRKIAIGLTRWAAEFCANRKQFCANRKPYHEKKA